MPARFLWALLVLSLALNVFFVGGVIYEKFSGDQAELESDVAVSSLASDLGLNDEQRQALLDLREKIRGHWQDARSASDSIREEMLGALSNPTFDEAAMQDLATRRYEPRSAAIVATSKDLHDYLMTLSDSQRIQFLDMAREPGFFRTLFARPKRSS